MSAAPELAVSAPRGAPYYVIGAFAAPHARARELMAEPRLTSLAWQVVLFSAVVSVIAGSTVRHILGIANSAPAFLPAEYAFTDMLLKGALACLIFVASFLLSVFLWSYLFGYRDQKQGVWAASALATCPTMVLSPLFSIGVGAMGQGFYEALGPTLVYALISALIAAIYYRATLIISYIRAVCLILLNSLIFIVGTIVLVLGGVLLVVLRSGSVTP